MEDYNFNNQINEKLPIGARPTPHVWSGSVGGAVSAEKNPKRVARLLLSVRVGGRNVNGLFFSGDNCDCPQKQGQFQCPWNKLCITCSNELHFVYSPAFDSVN